MCAEKKRKLVKIDFTGSRKYKGFRSFEKLRTYLSQWLSLFLASLLFFSPPHLAMAFSIGDILTDKSSTEYKRFKKFCKEDYFNSLQSGANIVTAEDVKKFKDQNSGAAPEEDSEPSSASSDIEFQRIPLDHPITIEERDGQRKDYCEAADDALKAADNNKLLTALYGGTAAICTAACAQGLLSSGTGMSGICAGANVVTAIADAALTKAYMNAVISLGGAALAFALSGPGGDAANKAGTDVGATGPGQEKWGDKIKRIGPCLSAGLAIYQTIKKNKTIAPAKEAARQNLDAVEELKDATLLPSTIIADAESSPLPSPGSTQLTLNQSQATAGSSRATASSHSGSNAMSGAASAGRSAATAGKSAASAGASRDDGISHAISKPLSFDQQIKVALKLDPKLSPILTHHQFKSALKKATRMSPEEFLSKAKASEKPHDIIAMVGRSLGSMSSEQKMAKAVSQMDKGIQKLDRQYASQSLNNGNASGYKGGSGSAHSRPTQNVDLQNNSILLCKLEENKKKKECLLLKDKEDKEGSSGLTREPAESADPVDSTPVDANDGAIKGDGTDKIINLSFSEDQDKISALRQHIGPQ